MPKNSDVIARNELYAERKAKANPLLPDLLKKGHFEMVEPEPCEKAASVLLADPNRVALQPTDKGIIAYYWFTKYNEQCRKTSEAYELGKKGAVLQIFSKIVKSLDMDFEELMQDFE